MALSNIAEIQNKGQHILKVELTALTNDWNKGDLKWSNLEKKKN